MSHHKGPGLLLQPRVTLSAEDLLQQSVDPVLDALWSKQIRAGGIIPDEIRRDEQQLATFPASMIHFGEFVGDIANKAFGMDESSLRGKHVHYVGVGTGHDFREVLVAANIRRMRVIAYDTATAGYDNAQCLCTEMGQRFSLKNRSYLADIEGACNKRFIRPKTARFLFLVRILEALNKPSKDPQKMERVCRKIGKLLQYLKVVVVGARPEDNQDVVFNNTIPEPLSKILQPMSEGLQGQVKATELGALSYYRHFYRATLIEKE